MALSRTLLFVLLLFGLAAGAFAQNLDSKVTNDVTVENYADSHRELKGSVNPCKYASYGDHCEYQDKYETKTGQCCGGKCKSYCPPQDPCKASGSDGTTCQLKDGGDGQCCGGKCKSYCPPPDPCKASGSDGTTCPLKDGGDGQCCGGKCKSFCAPPDPCKASGSDGTTCPLKDGGDGQCCGGKCKSYCQPPDPCKASGSDGTKCQLKDGAEGECCDGKCKSYCPPPVPICGYKPCKKTCCDSKCVDTNTDKKNCGDCGVNCEQVLKCKAKCVYGVCKKA